MKKQSQIIAFAIISALLLTSCGENPVTAYKETRKNFDFCNAVLHIFSIFQERIPANSESFAYTSDLYKTIGDKFTHYYEKDSALIFLGYLNTSSGGIGAMVDSVPEGILIRQVFQHSPGYLAGLHKNDTIFAINNISLDTMDFKTRLNNLHGNIGDVKKLSIRRANSGILSISVPLGRFIAPSVFADTVDSNIASILITVFADSTTDSNGTAAEFDSALEHTSWAKYTIIDLRSNGGGYIGQCLDMAGQFVPAGKQLMHSHERYYDSTFAPNGKTVDSIWLSKRSVNKAIGRKFYVLQDKYTASASEIMISVIRDYRQEIVTVGTYTYGKGKGQVVFFPTPDSGLAKVTYALINPMLGPSYDDEVGIQPVHLIGVNEDAFIVACNLIHQELGSPFAKKLALAAQASRYNQVRSQVLRKMIEPLAIMRSK